MLEIDLQGYVNNIVMDLMDYLKWYKEKLPEN